jgi:hypothetical protein
MSSTESSSLSQESLSAVTSSTGGVASGGAVHESDEVMFPCVIGKCVEMKSAIEIGVSMGVSDGMRSIGMPSDVLSFSLFEMHSTEMS